MDLLSIRSSNHDKITEHVVVHDVDHNCFDGLEVKSNFYFLRIVNDTYGLKEFVDYIDEQIVPFCIPVNILERDRKRYEKNGGIHKFSTEMRAKAINLFIISKKQRKKSGEVGELILFILQEAFLNAPQVSCKMILKTNRAMAIHGSDGIHMTEKDGELCVLWGESKIYKDAKLAVKRIIESIVSFNKPDEESGIAPKDRDIQILRDFPNVPDKELEEKILNYFDPYIESEKKEAYSCFIGFDLEKYTEIFSRDKDTITKTFKDEYNKQIKEICEAFSIQIKSANIDKFEFNFLLLPFESVADLRSAFFAKIGFPDYQEYEESDE
ncbi:MAG: hypothetical protein A2381_13485 [Bdellovibrionales bacterium RIFOXYB1_FULL_37_110]|nr:MAG: hypothetical protein A2417_08145 [Bdellovibrionales bacterium RIFOXYC1_FULL_37_79]OFZ59458.1 MAG: hypothetical protein A2381_13485 [Bdellovibrionales bacterium RIFOXYB1_FULL_37_110]OFZ64305.1 MAG: hypothetical protein A2577_02610 [Bdellovibrionales bacterium RIFOXYD1_FULL_36_51]